LRVRNAAIKWAAFPVMSHPLIAKLHELDRLSNEEEDALRSVVVRERRVAADAVLVEQGSTPTESTLLLEGITARAKTLSSGQRQITALHIPGDFVDLHSFLLARMDHEVVALTACRVAMVPHSALRYLTERFPHLNRLLWLTTLIDGSIHREWIVALGRRPAVAHMAHLLCELFLRMQAIGATEDSTFQLPLTQSELGDTLGLSTVHVNRVLQELRRAHVVEWVGRSSVTIRDWDGLVAIAEFDPTYLNLRGKPL
jgi:CRP-like cAMP-binding protein